MLRGLIKEWAFPFFCDFDCKVDVQEFQQIVREAAKFDFTVLVAICDQGGGNRGLATRLGVTVDEPFCHVEVSEEKSQKVFFIHDSLHLLKE